MERHQFLVFTLSPSLTGNFLTYPIILGNIETSGITTLYKHPIKCLELVFVSTNLEITMLYASISQTFIVFYNIKFCLLLSHQISTLLLYQKKLSLFFN